MMSGLTRYEARVLRMIRRGAGAYRDRERPCYLIFEHPGMTSFRTAQYMIERLQARRLIAPGDNMLALELTHEGIAALDGNRYEGKPTLPPGLIASAKSKAMAKLAELRREGFEDPGNGLLAIAFEVDEEGEWAQPMDIRIQCLTAAAPYCRPKLQAIIAKLAGATKSQADWVREMKEEIDGFGNGTIEGNEKGLKN